VLDLPGWEALLVEPRTDLLVPLVGHAAQRIFGGDLCVVWLLVDPGFLGIGLCTQDRLVLGHKRLKGRPLACVRGDADALAASPGSPIEEQDLVAVACGHDDDVSAPDLPDLRNDFERALGARLALDDFGHAPIPGRLLHHMRQLVSQQTSTALRCRGELADTEDNVAPYGVGVGVHISRRLLGGRARMHPHT
jgi:hypothetical protein